MSQPNRDTANAMLLHRPGTPETMVPGTIEVPSPRQGELRVQVLACGLNPVDWKTARTGLPSWSWPHVLGQDIVGIITAIGSDGDTTDLGRLAIVHQSLPRNGGLAQTSLVTAAATARIPTTTNVLAAATIPCAGLTAAQAVERTHVTADDQILIIGAAGAVGTFATQLVAQRLTGGSSRAPRRGEITALVGPADLDRAVHLGADEALDYTQGPLTEVLANRRFDVILDLVGAESSRSAGLLLGYGGRLASVSRPDWGVPPFTTAPTLVELALGAAYDTGTTADLRWMAATLVDLVELVSQGELVTPRFVVGSLDEAPNLLAAMASGESSGKPVIEVQNGN